MKKIYIPMMRYGDREFDEGFVGWGFQSPEEQLRDAQGVLRLTDRPNMRILDLACGLGNYHRVWLDAGHSVVGTDLSEMFIAMACVTNPGASYRVEDYHDLAEIEAYDLVTLIDTPVEDEELPFNVFRALVPGGTFIFQVTNPDYAHGPLHQNHRDWQENEDRTFTLRRNEYNGEVDRWEYEEWTLDLEKAEIVVQHNFTRQLNFARLVEILLGVGFGTVSFLDADGRPYLGGADMPKNYFCIARKGMLVV